MRRSGVLLHVSSLPSPYGIGTLGQEAREFIDYLADAGQSVWQMLPLNPTGFGDSPYASWATMAGNPYFIDLRQLEAEGLLKQDEYAGLDWGQDPEHVDYGALYNLRHQVLRKAVARMEDAEIEKMAKDERALEAALFMALKQRNDMKPWNEWKAFDRDFDVKKIPVWLKEVSPEVRYWLGVQVLFDKQFTKLKKYAEEKGIQLVGDIPFYVSPDSADVWANPELFQLDKKGNPFPVSGCPGQVWGNPLHDWEAQKKSGYQWWKDRAKKAADMYDILRLDHFIGFDRVYAIDPETKKGKWQDGPGMDVLQIFKDTGKEVIAEDLGDRKPSMVALLEKADIPGMMVMQYAFLDRMQEKGLYMPYNFPKKSVAYTGTHDNDTIMGWIKSLNPSDLQFARDFMHSYGNEEQLNWDMIRTLMAGLSETVILQAQDLKALDAPMNKPGTAMGNWTWRLLPNALDKENANWVRHITETYGRLPQKNEKEEKAKTAEI